MMKRIIAAMLLLATVICACTMGGCSTYDENEDKGQSLTMYLADEIYDLDPANAYYNQSTLNVVSLLFDTLFTLDSNGKIKNSLAQSWKVEENDNTKEYYMYITMRSDACWSDGSQITADDVVYAWKRLLTDSESYDSACLLFDIMNARLAKEGDKSIDDVQIYGDNQLLTIRFENKLDDYESFIRNLTSVALAPLKSTSVDKSDDWSKKGTNITCSGPFKISKISVIDTGRKVDKNGIVSDTGDTLQFTDEGYLVKSKEKGKKPTATGEAKACKEYKITSFVLERNSYYYRDKEKDSIKKSVTPYRLVFDASLTNAELLQAYNDGSLLLIGDIPLELRNELKDEAEISDSMTVNQIYFNLNANIENTKSKKTEQLFANTAVRQALSLAIDRTAIAEAAIFAEAATGLVPDKVYMTNSVKSTFRDVCGATYEYLATDMAKAKSLLADAKITASNYSFKLTYAVYDDVQSKTAEAIYNAWNELGFKVTLNPLGAIKNQDYYSYTDEIPNDICDDMYAKALKTGDFEVILLDYTASTTDAFGVLAPYAKAFSGRGLTLVRDEEETSAETAAEEETDSFSLLFEAGAANYIATPHITGYDSTEYNELIEQIFAEKKLANRKDLYIQAEKILMTDLPVIPVISYKSAYVASKQLKNVDDNLYYNTLNLKKVKLSDGDYEDYINKLLSFIDNNFETNKKIKTSYFAIFSTKSLDEFKDETSIYTFVIDYLKALTATETEKKKS